MSNVEIPGVPPLSQFLRIAVIKGVENAVQIHIDRGDDLNARDASGMTPLMLAAARNKSAICKLLLTAGADHRCLDRSGRTALEIAVSAGSIDAIAILGAVQVPTLQESPALFHSGLDPNSAREPTGNVFVTEAAVLGICVSETHPKSQDQGHSHRLERAASQLLPIDLSDGGEFDLSGWDAEYDPKPPQADSVVLESATAIQSAITVHEPIDSSTEWDDIYVFLAERALPLARTDDAENRALLRILLLRAIREGSVPSLNLRELSLNTDRSANSGVEAYLTMIVNDLGAEIDERFEYADANEDFEVFVDPAETSDEEETLDEALAAIDRAVSPRYEPVRIYQRDLQLHRLLTAEEEVHLGQAMEMATEAALDALANWPEGINRILEAGGEVIAGIRPLSSIWLSDPEPSFENAKTASLDTDIPRADLLADFIDGSDDSPGDGGFADALLRLRTLVELGDGREPSGPKIRATLAAMRLSRRFLFDLGNAEDGWLPCPIFRRTLTGLQEARNRMAVANLKLAFFHAKKYLFSGEPLDDLAQEGNIGLLKAVDRYEWRRGFRFSTYATWWIRQQIGRYVADKARTIRVPVHIYEKTQRMRRIAESFETAFDRQPTAAELAGLMEIPVHVVEALLRIAPEPCGIDESSLDEMIAIEARDAYASPDPADVVTQSQLRLAVEHLISWPSINDRKEQWILRLRFGIGVDDVQTLEEVALRFGLTRERIRQIEAKAIKKLRHPARSEPFARLVLGIKLVSAAGDDFAEAVAIEPAEVFLEPPTTERRLPGKSIRRSVSADSSHLDRLLARAAELGVPVEDGRSSKSGRIWVSLLTEPDNSHRRLARRLIDYGFEHWPGKGYWR